MQANTGFESLLNQRTCSFFVPAFFTLSLFIPTVGPFLWPCKVWWGISCLFFLVRTEQVPVISMPKPGPPQHSMLCVFWPPCRVHCTSKSLILVTKIVAKLPWFYVFIFRVYGLYVMVKETFAWKYILFKLHFLPSFFPWIWLLSLKM